MSGMKPKFMKDIQMGAQYYKEPNPYINAPSCHINLLELSRYARKHGKRIADLTKEEVKKFTI